MDGIKVNLSIQTLHKFRQMYFIGLFCKNKF